MQEKNSIQDSGIVNRVAESPLITFNLEDYREPGENVLFDIKDQLFQGLILREKDFRAFIKAHDWNQYKGKNVAIVCSADAIVPTWAYMLLAIQLQPVANYFTFGNLQAMEIELFKRNLANVSYESFRGEKIVIKGCGNVPVAAYVEVVGKLRPVADKLMYGEPCSVVPLYKKPFES